LAPKPDIEIIEDTKNTTTTSNLPVIDTAFEEFTDNENINDIRSDTNEEVVIATDEALPPPDVDYCHDLMIGNAKPVDNATRRELVSFCFYHMN